jgi:hypothetical protein
VKHKSFLIAVAILALSSLACVFAEQLMFGPDSEELPKSVESTPLTCTGDECLNVCLDNLKVALETRPFEPLTNEIYVEYKANITLVVYKVDGNELVDATKLWVPSDYLVYQEDTDAHQRIWDFYTSIIPMDQRSMVKEFVVFTDGPEGDLSAWVNRDLDNPEDWKVGFDILDSDYPLYLAETLIHETGHLITLNTSQIPYDEAMVFTGSQNNPKCPTYITNEGCSLPDSYINHFYQKFWKNLYDEWWKADQEAQKAETYEEYQSLLESFYQAHKDEFIDDYAATNIEEDLAESWTYFVLNPQPQGNDVATQKILFFYDFPELVNLREEVITGLCSYVSPK